ncbi:alpha-glucosidase-like [Microplitis mediator]|uniref:alpha-glucosidase-like n=1 Tax=Microplitis mediator TaxID=375433 RepID=UPI002554B298|nr:alpha-glucosidase-like [Microplitis mediator]
MLLTVVCVQLIWGLVGLRESVAQNATGKDEWWRDTFIYQVYTRSFKDSNGDGVGDLNGITSKLEHLVDLGVSAVWLSPIYASPMVDFGYDISNFTAIDPIFGTIDDFTRLIARAKALKLKVVLDFVPNHSSDTHPWFVKSVQRVKPFDEYYVWKDARIVNGTRKPPNNWLSQFQGSAWEWNDQRKQYYYHQFTARQPDFNYSSTALQEEMKNVLRFWLNRGVDGFRIGAINYLIEDSHFLDEPKSSSASFLPATDPNSLKHNYTVDRDQNYDILQAWRRVLDSTNGTRKVIMTEAYTTPYFTMKFHQHGSNIPFNFNLIRNIKLSSGALGCKGVIDGYLNELPSGALPNWVVGNHDNRRTGSRLNSRWIDQINMIAAVLPGVAIIYNGDEIGMIDRPMAWNETLDPAGINAGPLNYKFKSRDSARTPFQWDNSTSAGFSSNKKTWLPVNSNYKTVNLAIQKTQPYSHYSLMKKLISLKKNPILRNGTTETTIVHYAYLAIVRRLQNQSPVVLLINVHKTLVRYDIAAFINAPDKMTVYAANSWANISVGAQVDMTNFGIDGYGAVILI